MKKSVELPLKYCECGALFSTAQGQTACTFCLKQPDDVAELKALEAKFQWWDIVRLARTGLAVESLPDCPDADLGKMVRAILQRDKK